MSEFEPRVTLIEKAGGDWDALDALVRDAISQDIETSNERLAIRAINRATHSMRLRAKRKPMPEDRGMFMSALLQRYIEEIDTDTKMTENDRQYMLANAALFLDVYQGDQDAYRNVHIATQYQPFIPAMKAPGSIVTVWSDAISESARLVHEDLRREFGEDKPDEKELAEVEEVKKVEKRELKPGEDTIEGYTDLRSTIIDLLENEDAVMMTRDNAAALLVGLGIEKPAQAVSFEKLHAYKSQALQWLQRQLAYVRDSEDDLETAPYLSTGRTYLRIAAAKYPLKETVPAYVWLARHLGSRETQYLQQLHAEHTESYMAFALDDLMRRPR